ncbi:hypothetical protein [Enterobacter phage 03_vB_Eclo_IJM]|nr:hypothetical protein [Enterobacter phage 03_vB_Eclo_IJM]
MWSISCGQDPRLGLYVVSVSSRCWFHLSEGMD